MKFLLTFLLLLPSAAWAYEVLLFPSGSIHHPDPKRMDQNLGLIAEELLVEDFEDSELIEGLRAQADFGKTNAFSAWDGSQCAAFSDNSEFRFSIPHIRVFGIGLGDNGNGEEWISINGKSPIRLNTLSFHTRNASGRAYYLLVVAEPHEEDIERVLIGNGVTMTCDHLLIKIAEKNQPPPLRLLFELKDSSRLIGQVAFDSLAITPKMSSHTLEIPMERIQFVEFEETTVVVTFANGDELQGRLHRSFWELSTILGNVRIDNEAVRQIIVSKGFIGPLAFFNRN